MRRTTLTRHGRQHTSLAAVAVTAVHALLTDTTRITAMLGDLIDQERSVAGPSPRWVVSAIHLGAIEADVTLVPWITETADGVRIVARSLPGGRVTGSTTLDMTIDEDASGGATGLTTDWRLDLGLPLPRPVVRAITPALERSIDRVVTDIHRRTAATLAMLD